MDKINPTTKLFYYIIHSFTGCNDNDLEYSNKGKKATCKKCGRIQFIFEQF